MGNLSENSLSYYEKNKYYEIFSNAEDYPKKIDEKLIKYCKNKKVLDAGCGTGKFSDILINNALLYMGVDKSKHQINMACNKINNKYFIVSDLLNLNFNDNSFDIVISSWCLGTIPLEKRLNVLKELIRVCKENIILVENLKESEFELIREHNKDNITTDYLNFLNDNNFKLVDTVNTYFQFENLNLAKEVFNSIYNKKIANNIKSNVIEHKVGIYRLDVNK